tara:strand:- start:1470 stop:3137 length:1668 start_codon:yes stop_codon:yes gene_type:complete
MPIMGDGEFFFELRNMYGGIRQDLHDMSPRYTCIKNFHHARLRALTKNTGYRVLNTGGAISGSPAFDAGLYARFNNNTHKVYALAGTDSYIFNTDTFEFDAQSRTLTQSDNADIQLFANEVYIANGTQFEKHDGASTWAAVDGARETDDGSIEFPSPIGTMLAQHANRLIVSGRPSRPYEFYFSGVRDGGSWDVTNNKIIVSGTEGELITAIHELGDFLFVGTRTGMWLYQQSSANPKDWDHITLSEDIGPINDRSLFVISRHGLKILCFWTDDGPACAYARGHGSGGSVGWKPLWEPIVESLRGKEIDQVPALEENRFGDVSGGYQPFTDQACFGVREKGASERNGTIRFDVRGLIAYIKGDLDQPVVCFRDNSVTGVYPCDILFPVFVDKNGLLDVTGRPRLFGGRQGTIYELDPPDYFTDNGSAIPVNVIRGGFAGQEEGIGGFNKVCQRSRVRGTQSSNYSVTVTVISDGGAEADSDAVSLDAGLGAWGDGGEWTAKASEGRWNESQVKYGRGNHGVHGQNFNVQIQDNGSINSDFELIEISVAGLIYERL